MNSSYLHLLRFGLLLFLSIIVVQCEDDDDEEEPIPAKADFSADNAGADGITIQCGECVTFEDSSSGDVGALFWDFEGGDPSTSEEDFRVTVCYANPGKYDVSLSVNAGESRITINDYVCVEGKPEELNAEFSADRTEIIQGQEVAFTDESTGSPTRWSWIIGKPGGSLLESNEQNPRFTFSEPGLYRVILIVARDNSVDQEEKIDYIYVLDYEDFACTVLSASGGGGGLFTQHTFNGVNQLIRADQFLNGILEEYSTYQWDNLGLLTQVDFFDVEAGILGNDTLLGAQLFEYFTNNQLKSQKFLDSRGNITADYNFTADQGLIIEATLDLTDGFGGFNRLDIAYRYDSSGLNVNEELFTFNGLLSERREYQFDTNPRALGDMQIEPFPNRSWKNNLIKATFFNSQNQIYLDFSSTYEYNEFGRPVKEIRDDLLSDFIWEYICEQK